MSAAARRPGAWSVAIEGYASLFHVEDLARDVVMPGAFAQSLAARGAEGVRMLWRHDPDAPAGLWARLSEDRRGLRVAGHVMAAFPAGRAVVPDLLSGRLDGLSIGFRPVTWRRRPDGVRELMVIELHEVSLVAFPMLPRARLSIVQTPESMEECVDG